MALSKGVRASLDAKGLTLLGSSGILRWGCPSNFSKYRMLMLVSGSGSTQDGACQHFV